VGSIPTRAAKSTPTGVIVARRVHPVGAVQIRLVRRGSWVDSSDS
jgi:hypothetical protein